MNSLILYTPPAQVLVPIPRQRGNKSMIRHGVIHLPPPIRTAPLRPDRIEFATDHPRVIPITTAPDQAARLDSRLEKMDTEITDSLAAFAAKYYDAVNTAKRAGAIKLALARTVDKVIQDDAFEQLPMMLKTGE